MRKTTKMLITAKQVIPMKQTLFNASQLGRILRSARRARKLSQAEAASRIGLSQSRLSAMEIDPKSVTVEQLLMLGALYGLDLVVQSKSEGVSTAQTDW
jgi:HTH-type transcriptional regulator/antitoxin HipB